MGETFHPLTGVPTPLRAAQDVLRLHTFGRCDLVRIGPDHSPHIMAHASKGLVLLAYLAAAPRRSATRERLASVFWPDRPDDRGRHALRQQLVNLRKLLGPEAILVSDQRVTLHDQVADDRTDLVRAARAGDLDAVTALYDGEFLPELEASGGIELQHWCIAERHHLRGLFIRAARERIPVLIAEECADAAVHLATRLRDTDPEDEQNWRVLLHTLVRTGRLLDARLEAEVLESRQHADGRAVQPETAGVIDRIRGARATRTTGASDGLTAGTAPGATPFVGRAPVVARLLARWQGARNGRTEVVAVSASPGIGKTRLLQEVMHRLRADGARVVQLRAYVGERSVGFSLAGDLALRLGKLPGAGGVAPETSGILVTLAPELSSHFPAAQGERLSSEQSARVAHALAELVRCVAEERPLALLLDDWHWADRESTRAVEGLIHRLDAAGVLVVFASRMPVTFDARARDGIVLQPLTVEDTRAFLVEAGELPESLTETLPALVHAGSQGSPLLMLHLLRHARDRGWLILGESWDLRDGEAFGHAARAGGALESRMQALMVEPRTVLHLIAIDGVPVPNSVLARSSGLGTSSFDAAILTLEQCGLVEHVDGAWRAAHDEVAKAATFSLEPDDIRAFRVALGEAYAGAEDCGDEIRWRRAAAHLLAGGAEQRFVALARSWLARTGVTRRPGARDTVAALFGQELPDAVLQRVCGPDRSGRRRPVTIALAGGLVATVVVLAAIANWQTRSATHLRLDAVPVATLANEPMVAPFVVSVTDARGRVIPISGDTVHAVAISGGTVLRGGSVPIVRGSANLSGLVLRGDSAVRLRLSASRMPALLTDSIFIGEYDAQSSLQLIRGTVGGTALSPSSPVLRVAPGTPLVGMLEVDYTSAWPGANVVMVLTATWGDRASRCRRVTSLVTPVRHAVRHVQLDERAPDRPGRYYLVLAFQAEDGPEYVCSGTNWTYGRAVWHDGNDLADWGEAQAEVAAKQGRVQNGFLSRGPDGSPRRTTYSVPTVMIRVDVEASAAHVVGDAASGVSTGNRGRR